MGVDVGVELGDDAGRLAFDLDLEDGLDLAGGDDGAGDVAALDLTELRGLELGVGAASRHDDAEDDGENENGETAPEPEVTFLFWCHGSSPEPRVLGLAARRELTQASGGWFREFGNFEREQMRGFLAALGMTAKNYWGTSGFR